MPWVKEELCTGCGSCIGQCPVGAMQMQDNHRATINEVACIRCGRCHDVCPEDAVRHDSERIPQEVAANLQWVFELLDHFQEPKEQTAFIKRMIRFFNKQRKVSEQTIATIKAAEEEPYQKIHLAIKTLTETQNP